MKIEKIREIIKSIEEPATDDVVYLAGYKEALYAVSSMIETENKKDEEAPLLGNGVSHVLGGK